MKGICPTPANADSHLKPRENPLQQAERSHQQQSYQTRATFSPAQPQVYTQQAQVAENATLSFATPSRGVIRESQGTPSSTVQRSTRSPESTADSAPWLPQTPTQPPVRHCPAAAAEAQPRPRAPLPWLTTASRRQRHGRL